MFDRHGIGRQQSFELFADAFEILASMGRTAQVPPLFPWSKSILQVVFLDVIKQTRHQGIECHAAAWRCLQIFMHDDPGVDLHLDLGQYLHEVGIAACKGI